MAYAANATSNRALRDHRRQLGQLACEAVAQRLSGPVHSTELDDLVRDELVSELSFVSSRLERLSVAP